MFGTYFPQGFSFDFDKDVNIKERVDIAKQVLSLVYVQGNLGNANAKADAFGYDTVAETLTATWAIQGFGSGAVSESTAGTNGAYYHY